MIKLPPIPQPFPATVHPRFNVNNPELDRFEAGSRAFADRFKLYPDESQRQRLFSHLSARLAAMMYPVGRDELLQVGADFVMWAFAYDDEYCDEGPLSQNPYVFIRITGDIQRAAESLEYESSQDRYAQAMRDLVLRLHLYAPAGLASRFVDAFRTYTLTEMWRSVVPKPSLDEYIWTRLYSGGGWAFPQLAHIIAGLELAPNEYADRRVRALAEMISSLMVWDTDPYAYVKEGLRTAAEKEHNILTVICTEFNYSFEQAFAHYLNMRVRLISLFQRLRAAVYLDASPAVRAYIDGLVSYYAGAAEWCFSTRRYTSASGLESHGAFEGGELINVMPEESFESLGLPSVEWWWKLDPARTRDNRPQSPQG